MDNELFFFFFTISEKAHFSMKVTKIQYSQNSTRTNSFFSSASLKFPLVSTKTPSSSLMSAEEMKFTQSNKTNEKTNFILSYYVLSSLMGLKNRHDWTEEELFIN